MWRGAVGHCSKLVVVVRSVQLELASAHDSLANVGGVSRARSGAKLFIVHRGHIDMDVDAVKQRSGNLRHVALNHRRSAMALAAAVVEISAGTRVHRGSQHEAGRKGERHGGAGDANGAVFERLAHDFQDIAGELRKFVQKKTPL